VRLQAETFLMIRKTVAGGRQALPARASREQFCSVGAAETDDGVGERSLMTGDVSPKVIRSVLTG
jgi:hypothetical protein